MITVWPVSCRLDISLINIIINNERMKNEGENEVSVRERAQ